MIKAAGITKTYAARGGMLSRGAVPALRGVDFEIADGGAVSFIGESGCGKTTLGRILCGLETFDGGELIIDGADITGLSPRKRAPHFRRIQMIHQDPYSALNPTRTIEHILHDPLKMREAEVRPSAPGWIDYRMKELLSLVGLDPSYVLPRYPHMLSGGMRQRVVVARALTVDPTVLVADEAVSMIDVSLRLGILGLLRDLRTTAGIAVLFITHDVATARYIGDDGELYVLYRGLVIERGSVDTVIGSPEHPYTQSLLSAIPVLRGLESPGASEVVPRGPLDEHADTPGCLFAPRCPFVQPACGEAVPPLAGPEGHQNACLFPQVRSVVASVG